MFVSLMLGISEGNSFPGRQTLPVFISSISGRRKKRYTSQAVCSGAIQMQKKKKMRGVSVSELIVCAANHSARRVNHVCDIGKREKRYRRKVRFIFHSLFCCIIMTMPRASGRPVAEAHFFFWWNEMCCAVVPGCVWMRTSWSW